MRRNAILRLRRLAAARPGSIAALLVAMAVLLPRPGLADGASVIDAVPLSGAVQATHRADAGNVAIIEFVGNYDRTLASGAGNVEARAVVAREFLRTRPDAYDFIVVFTTFEFDTGDAEALHWGVQNAVQGIGLPEFDNTLAFGSDGRLLGYIDMAALSRHELDPQRPRYEDTLATLGHEMLHQWGAFVRFLDAAGEPSGTLLGKDAAHWSDLLDTDASVLYGHDWRDNGDGSFTSLATRRFWSPLDLYVAGFLAPEEVPPFILIDSPGHAADVLPVPNLSLGGTPATVRIDDVIAAEGPRSPATADAQKDFRLGLAVLVAPGEPLPVAATVALEELGRRYGERFSAWTGGRARAQLATEAFDVVEAGAPREVTGDGPRAGDAVVDEGIAWLRERQRPEGFWEDKAETRVRDTEEALRALLALDRSFAGGALAGQWLAGIAPQSTDFIARRRLALAAVGAIVDNPQVIAARQNADGGWGVAPGFASNPLDTALALRALGSAAPPDVATRGRDYLLGARNADGGWGGGEAGPSRTGVTTRVLDALEGAPRAESAVETALDWLASTQNADGGFGDSPSTVHDTASVLLALIRFRAIDRVRGDDAAVYLLDRQDASGSWEGSVYKTALAVRALRQFNFPNLRFEGALAATPAAPVDGDRVRVDVRVVNDANAVAPATTLRLFDGDPEAGGVAAAPDAPVPALSPGEGATVRVAWDTFGLPGVHRLVAVVDPDAQVTETAEVDNRVARELVVAVPPAGPALSVVAGTPLAAPAAPQRLPSGIAISATVRNAGDTAAAAVPVRLYLGTPADGVALATTALDLPARSSLPVNFVHELATAGETVFTIVVDPDGQVAEADESDNAGTVGVVTAPSIDLEVLAADIALSPRPAVLGSDARFTVTVRNRGTTPAASTRVDFGVTDGNVTSALLSATVDIPPGASVTRAVDWRVNLAGDLVFTAVVDPQDVVPELDETNNTASLEFAAGAAAGPNLVVSFEEFTASPDPGEEGRPLTLGAVVRNTGTESASDVVVRFYAGDPDAGGVAIGEPQTIAALAAGASAPVGTVWERVPDSLDRLLFVRVDPDDAIAEFSEGDNTTFSLLTVRSLPDLAVSSGAIAITPGVPVPGEPVSVAVTVTNLGQQPADGAVVRLFDGAPLAGGVAVSPDRIVSVPGGGAAVASFAFTLPGVQGARRLVAEVNPDAAFEESTRSNNRAQRDFTAQGVDFFVTERYVSPNGDGVQDDTRFFFSLAAPAALAVQVVDEAGATVRTLAAPAEPLASGDRLWDGLDDLGRVVDDGDYRVHALAAGGALLGEALVTVDNNRSSLVEAAGTPFGLARNLTCELSEVEFLSVGPDEQRVFLSHRQGDGEGPVSPFGRGILSMGASGADVRTLVPFDEDATGRDRVVRGMVVDPRGERIAYIRRVDSGAVTDRRLFVVNTDGSDHRALEFADRLPASVSFLTLEALHAFSAARDEVVVQIRDDDFVRHHLVAVPLDGGPPRVLVESPNAFVAVVASPDARAVAALSRERLLINDRFVPGDAILDVVDMDTGAGTTRVLGTGAVDPDASDLAWSADGERLAVRVMGGFGVEVGDGGPGGGGGEEESGASSAGFVVDGRPGEFGGLVDLAVLLYRRDGTPLREVVFPAPGLLARIGEGSGFASCGPGTTEPGDLATHSSALTWTRDGTTLFVDHLADIAFCAAQQLPQAGRYLFGPLYRVDVASGVAEAIAVQRGEEQVREPLVLDTDERAALYLADGVFDDVEENDVRVLRFDSPDVTGTLFDRAADASVTSLGAFPSGRTLLYQYDAAVRDPTGICAGLGTTDHWTFRSLLNLTADLRAIRSSAAGGILLQGTVADLHLAHWTLEYRPESIPDGWRPIVAPQTAPALDETLTVWVPPGPGRYRVRLTVQDRAGNRRAATARVSSVERPEITDLAREPDAFSPNGDGVRDTVALGYRVLQPTRLEFHVFDAAGDVVRTFAREHPQVGGVHEVTWDGRDDAGLVQPDGLYRIEVQGLEFAVTLDRTFPEVVFQGGDAYHAQDVGDRLLVASPPGARLGWAIDEPNHLDARVERSDGSAPDRWVEVVDPDPDVATAFEFDDDGNLILDRFDVPLALTPDSLFRIVVEDRAGNRTVEQLGPAPQRLIAHRAGEIEADAVAALAGAGTSADVSWRRIPFAPFDSPVSIGILQHAARGLWFDVAHTFRDPLSAPALEFRRRDESDWTPDVVEVFDDGAWVWRVPALEPGVDHLVRLTARAGDGSPVVSNVLEFQVLAAPTVVFKGRAASAGPEERQRPGLTPARRNGEDLLWAANDANLALDEIALYLQSDDDPRFALETRIRTLRASGRTLIFAARLRPCARYEARLIARTADRRRIESRNTVATGCIDLVAGSRPVVSEVCGAGPTNRMIVGMVPIVLEPDVVPAVLTLARVLDGGVRDVIANVNKPTGAAGVGAEDVFGFNDVEIDVAALPEGVHVFEASVVATNGEVATVPVNVEVDRTPPEIDVLPPEGALLCAVPTKRNVGSFEPGATVVADFLDRNPATGALSANRDVESRGGITSPVDVDFERGPPGLPPSFAASPLRVFRHEGLLTAEFQLVDPGGARECVVRSFTLDALVDATIDDPDTSPISPNGDGFLDEVSIGYRIGEPLRIEAAVWRPEQFSDDGTSVDGPPVVTLIPGQDVLPGESSLRWDGRDSSGVVVPDGVHVVRFVLTDACGTTITRSKRVVVDRTPPAIVLEFPGPDDPLALVVEPVGRVTDPHMDRYRVEFGVGADPQTWALIAADEGAVAPARVLAEWNTFGLEGPIVLRVVAEDSVGNVGVLAVALEFAQRVNLIDALSAIPRLFSPNADGRLDTTAIRVGLEEEVLLDVDVLRADGTAVRALASALPRAPGAHAFSWDGSSDGGLPLADDTYRVQARAVLASNVAVAQEEAVTVVIDRTPPAITVTQPAAGFARVGAEVQGDVSDVRLREYVVEVADDPAQPVWVEIARGVGGGTGLSLGILSGLEEGERALRVRARDEAENLNTVVVPFVVDNTPPVPVISEPRAGAVVAGPVDVRPSVDEDNPGTWRLDAALASAPEEFTVVATGDGVPPEVVAWDTGALADGSYALRLQATDLAGNVASVSTEVAIDNTPPELSIASPVGGSFVSAPTAIAGDVADAHLVEYRVALAPAAGAGSERSPLAVAATAPASGTLHDWALLPRDGAYDLFLSARDAAGNEAETRVAVIVDTTPPAAPTGLTATAEPGVGIRVEWNANVDSDLAGYAVYRDGTRITPQPVAATSFLDVAAPGGRHEYTVTALDRATLESAPSLPAFAAVDSTPPQVRLLSPADGGVVSGLVAIAGSAVGEDDFKEYRVFVALQAQPDARQLLRRSPVPVVNDDLAQWETTLLAEGARFLVTLEADDINGNTASVSHVVTVDNSPPAVPLGLVAVATGADVDVDWQPNTEPDLLGYLLFRGDRLASVDGPALGDLRQFALPAPAFDDLAVPDGTHAYAVAAIDRAGNVSALSPPVEVVIDTRAPAALVVQPADGTRFAAPLFARAVTEDEDVASVQFQIRTPADAQWTDVGAPDTRVPYTAIVDPGALGLVAGEYRVRAVATDEGGRVDDAPAEIAIAFGDVVRPDAPGAPAASVDGGTVSLAWNPSAADDVVGYHVERASGEGAFARITTAPVAAPAFVDAGRPDGGERYRVLALDEAGNESDTSPATETRIWTPLLDRPFSPTAEETVAVAGSSEVAGSLVVNVTTALGSQTLPGGAAVPAGDFTLQVPLAVGANQFEVRVRDAAGNRSKPVIRSVVHGLRPPPPTGLVANVAGFDVALAWDASAGDLLGYRVYRAGEPLGDDRFVPAFPENSADGRIHTLVFPSTALVSRILVFFASQPASDFDIEGRSGSEWVVLNEVRGNREDLLEVVLPAPYATDRVRIVIRDAVAVPNAIGGAAALEVALVATSAFLDPQRPDGHHVYTVTAVSLPGFESEPSQPAQAAVGDVVGPDPVTLSATLAGSDATLFWTPSASPDTARYELFRDGETVASLPAPGGLGFVDAALRNGVYRYVVQAVDALGNRSAPSNEVVVSVDVAPPPAPLALSVTPRAAGGALGLAWQAPGAGPAANAYRIARSRAPGGPYAVVADTPGDTLTFVDEGLVDGTTYYYVVRTVDVLGNVGVASNEASGTPRDVLAPAAPVITRPARAGLPVVVAVPIVDVGGITGEPVTVTLFGDGAVYAETGVVPVVSGDEGPATEAGAFIDFSRAVLSPDGSRIAYQQFGPDAALRLYVYDFDRGERTLLDTLAQFQDFYTGLAWTPDGRRVLASVLRTVGIDQVSELRAYPLDGGAVEDLVVPPGLIVESVRVSPDGLRIAVTAGPSFSGATGLWVREEDEAAFRERVPASGAFVRRNTLRWSPDGRRIAFVDLATVKVIDVDAATITTVADAGIARAPSWSADGELLFEARIPPQFRIVAQVWDPADGTLRTVAEDVEAPQWADAGGALFGIAGGERVVRVELATGDVQILFDGAGTEIASELLVSTVSGAVVFETEDRSIRRVRGGFQFEVPGVLLNDGDNVFTATARDAAGNVSPPSQPVVVSLRTDTLPDLSLDGASIRVLPGAPGLGGIAAVGVAVTNTGDAASPATVVSLLAVAPDGGAAVLLDRAPLAPLGPGAQGQVTASWDVGDVAGVHTLVATVDVDDVVAERSEADNFASRDVPVAPAGRPALGVRVSGEVFLPGDTIAATVTVANAGPVFSGVLGPSVVDGEGFVVSTLAPVAVTDLAFGDERTIAVSWPVGSTFAGEYRVVATLRDDAGGPVAEAADGFAVGETSLLDSETVGERPAYGANQNVRVTGVVRYGSGNRVVSGAVARLEVVDAAGALIAGREDTLADLLPGAGTTLAVDFNTAQRAPGPYTARTVVTEAGEVVASSETVIQVVESPLTLAGALSLSVVTPEAGTPQQVVFVVRNDGNAPAIGLPLRLRLLDPEAGVVIDERVLTADVPVAANAGGSETFATDALAIRPYRVVLEALPASGAPRVLVSDDFRVVDRTPPDVVVRSPTAGAVVRGDARARVFAIDADSPVERVEVRIDGGAFRPAPVQDLAASLYGIALPGLTDGPHTLAARAFDTAGNFAASAPVSFEVRNGAPAIVISGVTDGEHRAGPVTPVVSIEDPALASSTVALDGATFASATTLTADGDHLLTAFAENAAGNRTSVAVRFTIDTVAPAIAIDGVADGQATAAGVTPVVTVTDRNLDVSSVTLDGVPFVSGTPIVDEGRYRLEVRARDRAGNAADATVSFLVDRTPPAIVVEGVADGQVFTGDPPYRYDVDALDPDGDAVTYELATAPAGMRIDSVTGEITWKPSTSGDVPVSVRASDGQGGTDSQRFTLTVTPPNAPPVLLGTPDAAATVGLAWRHDAVAADPDGDALTFELVEAPVGMTVDARSGVVTWTPQSAGPADVVLRVSDPAGASAEQRFTIDVAPGPLGAAPSTGRPRA